MEEKRAVSSTVTEGKISGRTEATMKPKLKICTDALTAVGKHNVSVQIAPIPEVVKTQNLL